MTASLDRRAGARRRRLRDQQHPGRRPRGDRARPRDPGAPRPAPDDRRHARHRRHHPHAAHGARDARHRQRHGRGLPGRVAPQLHEPDGDDLPARLPGDAAEQGRRALPLGTGHDGDDRRSVRRAGRGGHLLRRGHQSPDLSLPPRARRREPLPEARRGDRGQPRPAAARARRHVPPARLLPDRVERAQRRVLALVHAPRLRDRAPPHPGRRSTWAVARRASRSTSASRPSSTPGSRSRSSAAGSTPR